MPYEEDKIQGFEGEDKSKKKKTRHFPEFKLNER
jgi:hypothetical protein